ncbi:MAG: FlgD immunoglobulin-like domain containing protein [bacterium]
MPHFIFRALLGVAIGLASALIVVAFPHSSLAQDTTFVYGGPGSIEGRFEDAYGLPDRQGWLGVSITDTAAAYWQIDFFNCDNLDPGQPDNHAWWCGADYTPCSPEDPPGGYGNNLYESLEWYGTIADPGSPVTVTINAVLNHDTEPGYDVLYLEYESQFSVQSLRQYEGLQDGVIVAETVSLTPADYVGPNNDQVHLLWSFVSDGLYSAEDCDWPNDGAAQIDRIEVFFDQGGGPVLIGATETCEPGDPVQWTTQLHISPDVGDFSQVWPMLDDLDPAVQNDTPQFAFIDDGIVVPGTGGSEGINWTYGPGGYTIYMHLLEPWTNEIWSPPITLSEPAGAFDAVVLTYDVYEHIGLCQPQGGRWRIRSRSGGDWSAWLWPEDWITAEGEYLHIARNVKPYLDPGDTELQIALGVGFMLFEIWCWEATGQTPAPYYDDVSVAVVTGLADLPERSAHLQLSEPAPNPFNPATNLEFTLPNDGQVKLAVYDLRGRLVRRLLDEIRTVGTHTVSWNGRDDTGASVAAGTYVFRLQAGDREVTTKGSLLK